MKKLLINIEPFRKTTTFIPIQKGLYKSQAELYFNSNGNTTSNFSEHPQQGLENVSVTSIDSIVSEDVSFIKMDIESFEPYAIEGAQKTITKSYPKLAICIYHKTSHLWEIPLMIKELFPKYTHFEVRHYNKTYSETVFYAYK